MEGLAWVLTLDAYQALQNIDFHFFLASKKEEKVGLEAFDVFLLRLEL